MSTTYHTYVEARSQAARNGRTKTPNLEWVRYLGVGGGLEEGSRFPYIYR